MEKNQIVNKLLPQFIRSYVTLRSPWIVPLLLIAVDAYALFDNYWSCAQSIGRANTGVAVQNGAASMSLNPAAAFTSQKIDVVFSCAKLFGLQVRFTNAACKLQVRNLTFGCLVELLGNQKYSENCFHFSGSIKVLRKFYFGGSLRYGRIDIANYGSAATVMVDAGTLVRLSDSIMWGTCIQNLNNAVIGPGKEELPQLMKTGFACRPNDHLLLALELVKDLCFPVDFRCGVESSIVKNLTLRAGIGSSPIRFSAGLSIGLASFGLHYAYLSHTDLNPTHMFTIGFTK
jgi:hypothetical protein